MDKIYKVGIVGCGRIFPMHACSIQSIPQCKLTAVCDIKPQRAEMRAEEFSCRAYTDYREMIENEQLDVLHICTPHYLHPVMAIYALEHGVCVMTEKPMSIAYADTVAMVEAARRSGKILGVIFQNRYNPGSVLAKQAMESGRLGKVLGAKLNVTWMRTDDYYARSDWKGTWNKEGGGVLIDQAIHTVDLLCWIMNESVDFVDVSIANRMHHVIEVEDVAEGVIVFRNGVLASFYTINYYSRDSEVELEFHCERGSIRITADRAQIVYDDGRTETADQIPGEHFDYGEAKSYWGVSHKKQIQEFYKSLLKGENPEIDGKEAMKTMKLICALYKSGKEKGRIHLSEKVGEL